MNILIKLMSIVSLVIAPFIAGKTFGNSTSGNNCKPAMECSVGADNCSSMNKCDMSKCATMTKDQCAAYCDSMGCSPEHKAECLANYDANGKYVGKKDCCKEKEAAGHEGCSNEPACKEDNDKTCSKGDACCKAKK